MEKFPGGSHSYDDSGSLAKLSVTRNYLWYRAEADPTVTTAHQLGIRRDVGALGYNDDVLSGEFVSR